MNRVLHNQIYTKQLQSIKIRRTIYAARLLQEGAISKTYLSEITTEFKEMLSLEFDKSKEDSTSKLNEFMPSTWNGYVRRQLDAMLQMVDTLLCYRQIKKDCQSSFYGTRKRSVCQKSRTHFTGKSKNGF